MTDLAHPDIVGDCNSTSKKVVMDQDIIYCRSWSWLGWQNYGNVVRVNAKMEPVWVRQIFEQQPGFFGPGVGATDCAFSPDKVFLYVTGAAAINQPHFFKLNVLTGETIWVREISNINYNRIAVSSAGDIYIQGQGVVKKYDEDGNELWDIPETPKDIATDSNGNLYMARNPFVDTNTIEKYDADGNFVWGSSVGNTQYGIHVTVNDDIFTTGGVVQMGGDPPDDWHVIFKYAPDSSSLLASNHINSASTQVAGSDITSDKFGNVFAVNSAGYLEKFNENLVSQWGNDDIAMGSLYPAFATDAFNGIRWLNATISAKQSTGARDKNGNLIYSRNRKGLHNVNQMVVCPEVYVAKFTDEITNYIVKDMKSFQDNTIEEYNIDNDYVVNDIVYWDGHHEFTGAIWWELLAGIYKCLVVQNSPSVQRVSNKIYWEQIGKSPPWKNVGEENRDFTWDQYTDEDGAAYGGIGNSPLFYTVSFYNMLKVSDDSFSVNNGDYIMVRGHGAYGAFVARHHDAEKRLYFTTHEETCIDEFYPHQQLVRYGINANESAFFKYDSTAHDLEILININNENTVGTDDAIDYSGIFSMYPGRRETWDSVTVFEIDDIVAFHGLFYKATSQNQNSQPPSGNWSAIVAIG